MTDTRFSTVCDDLDELIDIVDIDEVGDMETLLMFVFARPIGVDEAGGADSVTTSLDITMSGSGQRVLSTYEFPMSVIHLVRSCAVTVADLGPYADEEGPSQEKPADVLALDDGELIAELQQALGKVRLYNLMHGDEEE